MVSQIWKLYGQHLLQRLYRLFRLFVPQWLHFQSMDWLSGTFCPISTCAIRCWWKSIIRKFENTNTNITSQINSEDFFQYIDSNYQIFYWIIKQTHPTVKYFRILSRFLIRLDRKLAFLDFVNQPWNSQHFSNRMRTKMYEFKTYCDSPAVGELQWSFRTITKIKSANSINW